MRDASVAVAATLVVGALVAALWPVGGGAPATAVLLVATGLVVVLADRAARLFGAWAVAAVAVAGVLVTAAVFGQEAFHRNFGPLGYANATAAWYAAGVGAACVVAIAAPASAFRVVGWGAALVLGVLPMLIEAVAASIAVAVTIGAAVAVTVRPSLAGAVARAAGIGAIVVGVATVVVGIARRSGRGVDLPVLGEARPRFWGEAVALIAQAPVEGSGAHGFARLAPSAADPDQAWAHHEFLELAVEHGILLPAVVTVAIAIALVALARRDDPVAAVGAVALAAATVLASVDYVWHDAAVPLTVAAVVGSALGHASRPAPAPQAVTPSSAEQPR